MDQFSQFSDHAEPTIEFHLLGQVDFAACTALQRRIVRRTAAAEDRTITVLLCEHPETITVGRAGSREHIRLGRQELTARRIDVNWISRGGGCILHGPGQLAVYPIVPLVRFGWTVGQYLRRLHQALAATLDQLGVRCETWPGRFGIGGRTGPLVAVGAAVQHGITCHGAFINVNPAMRHFGFVDTMAAGPSPPEKRTTMSCLLAERGRSVKMPKVRAAVVSHLATALGCDRYHLHTSHPLLPASIQRIRERAAHAS